jgi:hypothetical protein
MSGEQATRENGAGVPSVVAPASLYKSLLKAVVRSRAKVAIQAVDVLRLNRRFEYAATPYEVTARRALERVDQWCRDLGWS